MGSVVIIWVVFLALIIIGNKAKLKGFVKPQAKKTLHQAAMKSKQNVPRRTVSARNIPHMKKRIKSTKIMDSPVLIEDRSNDWLAKQLREEAKILQSGDMLDLGARHSKSCAAANLKYEHITAHDNSIDTGEYREI